MCTYTLVTLFVLYAHTGAVLEAATASIGIVTPNAEVSQGATVSFQIDTVGFSKPYYTVSDSFPGSSIANSNIDKNGLFKWQTTYTDVGTHELTVTVRDQNGNQQQLRQVLVVNQASPLSINSLTSGGGVFPGKPISFSVSALGYINPKFTVYDSFAGSSITSNTMSAEGNFGWTPNQNDVGTHNLTIRVTGQNGRTDTIYQTIVVHGLQIKNFSGSVGYVGEPVTFTITTNGILGSPQFRVSDSLRNNTVDNSALTDNYFKWIPTDLDIGTHTITITCTDMYNNYSTTDVKVTIQKRPVTSAVNSQTSTQTNTQSSTNQPNSKSNTTESTAGKMLFIKNLKEGSKGTEVSVLQKKLKAEGFYSGPINGSFGPLTKTAVVKFQKAKKIKTTSSSAGIVGPSTREYLNK